MVVVSHTRKNYFNWALSDWAIKANVWVLTFAPPQLPVYNNIFNSKTLINHVIEALFNQNYHLQEPPELPQRGHSTLPNRNYQSNRYTVADSWVWWW